MKNYNITVESTFGSRQGTLSVSVEGTHLSGTLSLRGQSEPFEGTIDKKGNCTFTGKIKNAFRVSDYTATGWIDEKELQLTLTDEKHIFDIKGTAAGVV